MRSRQNRKGAEVGFARETRRSNIRRISSPKREPVRRTWSPTTSLVTACSALPFVERLSWYGSLGDQGDRTNHGQITIALPCNSPLTTLLYLCRVSFFCPHP